MKKTLLVFVILMSSCAYEEPGTLERQTRVIGPVPCVTSYSHDGHEYVIAYSSEGCSIIHSASCSHSQLTNWQILQMAIAMTESQFNTDAVGKNQDIGVFQITPIYAREASRLSQDSFSHDDAHDVAKSIQMFHAVQDHHNPNHDIEKAISLHNKAPWYKKRVMENIEFIRRMELTRQNIIEYGLR